MTMKNIMVDLETTGLESGRHAILQISAWRFGLNDGEIDPQPFNRCLWKPAHRAWDEGTRNWWYGDKERREILQSLMVRAEDPRQVMEDFVRWCRPEESPIFWSKPSHFDFPFIQSYCADYGLLTPFHYRMAQDMNTFIRGLHFPNEAPPLTVKFEGVAHDAIFDTLNQIQVLWAHLNALGVSAQETAIEGRIHHILGANEAVPDNLIKVEQ